MTAYLTEEEIPLYCGLYQDISMDYIEAASTLIDAYKGRTLFPVEHEELVRLDFKRYMPEFRGKLNHFPRVEISSVVAKFVSPFGRDSISLDSDCLEFDSPDSLYFTFIMPRKLMFRLPPKQLRVKYSSGYKEPPEQIKRACGILAGNIKQMGGVMRWKQRDDYDIKVTLADEGVFSSEVKQILNGVLIK